MELKCQNSHDFALWAPIFKMYSYFWIGFKLEKKTWDQLPFPLLYEVYYRFFPRKNVQQLV